MSGEFYGFEARTLVKALMLFEFPENGKYKALVFFPEKLTYKLPKSKDWKVDYPGVASIGFVQKGKKYYIHVEDNYINCYDSCLEIIKNSLKDYETIPRTN